jgi:hypothetical protein
MRSLLDGINLHGEKLISERKVTETEIETEIERAPSFLLCLCLSCPAFTNAVAFLLSLWQRLKRHRRKRTWIRLNASSSSSK